MRRVGLAVVLAGSVLTGCGSFRDVFSSHAETAARAGSRQLKSAYVADIIGRVGGPNANPQAAAVVAGIWVDLSLFADRIARGTLKPDSALLERLLWPQLSQSKTSAWHDSVAARRPLASAASADSLYTAGEQRIFQHILILPTGLTAADSAKAKAQAERLLPQARADFGKTAAQYSSDTQNKADKGLLPLSGRGVFDPLFETAAWTLSPGQVTGPVKTSFGYHLIRRPAVAEVRERIQSQLNQAQAAVQDSVYFAELTEKNQINVKSGAPATMRNALGDLSAARKSGKELVSFKNGTFTVADFARWMTALNPAQLGQIREANDTLLIAFAKNLAQNQILLRQADSAKITVSPAIYQGMVVQYEGIIHDLQQAIGLDGPEFSDSSKVPVAEREKLAGQKVDDYFDRLTKGQAQFRQVPPTLSAELRNEGDYKIYQAGIAKAVELILAKRRVDSAAAAAGAPPTAPPGALQPAPGGPPKPNPKP